MSLQLLPHQTRVLKEADELSVKIEALDNFIRASVDYTGLSDSAKNRLKEQLRTMEVYRGILRVRVGAFILGEDG